MTSTRSSGSLDWRASADLEPLVKNWWMMAARGGLAVLFGCVMVLWRLPVLDAIIVPFAAYAIVDGLLAIASAFRAGRPRIGGWPIALEGIVSIGLGGLVLTWPLVPRAVFVLLAAWGLLTGIFEIIAALRLPRELTAHWLLATGGASSIFLALFVLALLRDVSDRIVLGLAVYAIVFGIAILLAVWRFRLASRLGSPGASRGSRSGRP
jgi:uncharacterized membrane protein HdeD (DUF308 family)